MKKKYFSEVEKCVAKNYAPCHRDKEQLAEGLQLKAQEVLALARSLLADYLPQDFELPKILLLPVRKTQSFGKYAPNMICREQEKLAQLSGAARLALEEKLTLMQANIKIERPVRGSFFAEGGIVIYYCTICELCAEEQFGFEEYVEAVLAHEIFHALHFACCESTQNWKQHNYWNGVGYELSKVSVVRESLAEYFRHLWLQGKKQEALLADMAKELAEPYAVVPNYPYAGVKCLLDKQAALATESFVKIFKLSLEDWHLAYNKLIS